MPSRGQSITITYIAWDTNANVGKSGDVANHTLRWVKDGTAAAPTNAASEIDATNAPGAYRITLTSAECTCHTGVLVGKSSTANVSIIPASIAFEQLPTATPGASTGVPVLDASLRIDSNIKAIDGNATNGNNATLKLKSLDIRSNDVTVNSVDVRGFAGTAISPSGGKAINIEGGSAYEGDGGHGIRIKGGQNFGAGTTKGYAVRVVAGPGLGGGIYLSGTYGDTPLKLEGDGYTSGMVASGGYETLSGILANITGSITSIENARPKKNVGFDNFMFPMYDAATKNPKIGLTVSAQRAIDGNTFSQCTNSVVELSNGIYKINLSPEDMNGDKIMFRFSSAGADDQLVEIITQD